MGERRIDPDAGPLLALVLLLGLEAGRKRAHTEIAELLWPHADAEIRQSRLRCLATELQGLVSSDETHLWIEPGSVSCDFDESLGENADAVFMGYEADVSPGFDAWLNEQRARIRSKVVHRLLAPLGAAARAGEWKLTASLAQAVRRVDPSNEEGCLRLAEALCRIGERSRGLDVLADYSELIGHRRPENRRHGQRLAERIRAIDDATMRPEPRFVGRSAELRSIDELLASAKNGRGGGFVLTGSAGIGKSRLLDEASLRASMSGMQVVRLSAQRGDATRPLSCAADLASALLGLLGSLWCPPEHLEHLYRIMNGIVRMDESEERLESASLLRQRVTLAVLNVIESVARETPLLIQVDDAQWLDEPSRWLFSSVVPETAAHRVAWMFATRPTPRREMDLKLPAVPVLALDRSAAGLLVNDLITRFGAPREVDRDILLIRGGGSPFFLRELVRHSATAGMAGDVPATVTELVAAGTSSLGPYPLRVLQIASILGAYATLDRIEILSRIPRDAMLEAITELEAAAILSVDTLGVVVTHALWIGSAVAQLESVVAAELHRRAAEQFESELTEAASAALLWECARHWSMAGELDRARRATLAGVDLLERTGFTTDAAAACARAVRWTESAEQRLALLDRQIRLLHEAGQWSNIDAVIDEYDAVAKELDPSYEGHSEHETRRWRGEHHRTGNVREWINKSLQCARSEKASVAHRLLAARECALVADAESLPTLILVHELAMSLPAAAPTELWDRTLVDYTFELRCGNAAYALELAWRLRDIASRHPDRSKATSARGYVAAALALVGRVEDARAVYMERIERAKSLGQWTDACIAFDELVGLLFDFEPLPEIERLLGEMSTLIGAAPGGETEMNRIVRRAHTGQLLVMKGEFAAAEEIAFSKEEIARYRGRVRTRLLAVRLAIARGLGRASEAEYIAELMSHAFVAPDRWLDWPATVYAEYVRDFRSRDVAAAFAQDFVYRVRRELYPPPSALADLAREAGSAIRPVA